MFAFICAFAPPVIVSGFILAAAVLNGGRKYRNSLRSL